MSRSTAACWIAWVSLGAACAGGGPGSTGSVGVGSLSSGGDTETRGTTLDDGMDADASGTAETGGVDTSGGTDEDATDTGPNADVGGGSSPCAIPGTEVWYRHAYRLQTGSWEPPQPLDQVWVGADAPPPRGIVAAAVATHSQRLFVFTESGCVHERIGSGWESGVVGERFAEAGNASLRAAAGAAFPEVDDLTLIDNPTAYVYTLAERANIVGEPLIVTMTDEPMGPPHGTGVARWAFAITEPELIDVEPWYDAYYFYDDGLLHHMNAGTASAPGSGWSSYPSSGGSNPFFGGAAAEPDPNEVRAAYYDPWNGRIYFIAPSP